MNSLRGKDNRGGKEKHAETGKNFAGWKPALQNGAKRVIS